MGSYKATSLKTLGVAGLQSIDLTTRQACAKSTCSALVAVECLPHKSSKKCTKDANGNIGTGNRGKNNYGASNVGNNNIGT
jgi:hypothetical protein